MTMAQMILFVERKLYQDQMMLASQMGATRMAFHGNKEDVRKYLKDLGNG